MGSLTAVAVAGDGQRAAPSGKGRRSVHLEHLQSWDLQPQCPCQHKPTLLAHLPARTFHGSPTGTGYNSALPRGFTLAQGQRSGDHPESLPYLLSGHESFPAHSILYHCNSIDFTGTNPDLQRVTQIRPLLTKALCLKEKYLQSIFRALKQSTL